MSDALIVCHVALLIACLALAAPMLSSKLSRLEEQRDREQGPRT
mgnify:CR=1 FL=1